MPDPFRVNRGPQKRQPRAPHQGRLVYPISTFWRLWEAEGSQGGFYVRHATWPCNDRFLVVSIEEAVDQDTGELRRRPWGMLYTIGRDCSPPSSYLTGPLDDAAWSHAGQTKAKRQGSWGAQPIALLWPPQSKAQPSGAAQPPSERSERLPEPSGGQLDQGPPF